jgi:Flp pilus assembly pilin Flp
MAVVCRWLIRLAVDDRGQDLIEYALLTAFLAVGALLAMDVLGDAIAAAFVAWNGGVNALWETPPPG